MKPKMFALAAFCALLLGSAAMASPQEISERCALRPGESSPFSTTTLSGCGGRSGNHTWSNQLCAGAPADC
jgi:hypothetical protein